MLGAAMKSFKGSFSAQIIEAMGFRYALETALSWNYCQVIVEGMHYRWLVLLTNQRRLRIVTQLFWIVSTSLLYSPSVFSCKT